MTTWRRGLLAGLIVACVAAPVPAETKREVTVKDIPDGQILNLTQVVAPWARCAAVSEIAGVLAVGHRPAMTPGTVPVPGPHISLFRLDAEGKPTDAPPATIMLPRPDSLAAHPNYPLSLAFHPAFGLLYVWQDIDGPKREEPGDPERYKDFDHLLIYSVEEAEPKLLEAYGRGAGYGYGYTLGSIALNADATRLYLPNIQHAAVTGKILVCGVGCFFLDLDGLPLLVEPADAIAPVPPVSTGVRADPKTAAANRTARLTDQKAKAAGTPLKPRLLNTGPSATLSSFTPSGMGFAPVGENVVIFGGYAGPVTWDEGDRRARIMTFYTDPYIAFRQHVVGHPTLPVIFVAVTAYPYLYRMEHAEGHITLGPQQWTFEGATFHSPPVFMARRNQIAIGGASKVHVIGVDAEGFLKSERAQTAVVNPTVEAVVYSEKFDRLYVTIPEKPK